MLRRTVTTVRPWSSAAECLWKNELVEVVHVAVDLGEQLVVKVDLVEQLEVEVVSGEKVRTGS